MADHSTPTPTPTPTTTGSIGLPSRSFGARPSTASELDYDVPESYADIPEVAERSPVRGYDDDGNLEEGKGEEEPGGATGAGAGAGAGASAEEDDVQQQEEGEVRVSRVATEIYTVSYLILFSILGTLARLGLQALTYYPGAPVALSSAWPNFAGSLVMGFLSEDRQLFRHEWGVPRFDRHIRPRQEKKQPQPQQQQQQQQQQNGGGGGGGGGSPPPPPSDSKLQQLAAAEELEAAKKAHLATKKTIPLYIGLATGFCGSFTSFSSFVRDMFLATSNDLPSPDLTNVVSSASSTTPTTIPRSGGYSFMALVAVALTTVALSLSGLFLGAHVSLALEKRVTPSLPFRLTRRVLDPLAVLLGWGCWIGAILLSALPPDRFATGPGAAGAGAQAETWRGRATFALVFAPLGCLLRFYASLRLNPRVAAFPLGTFAVNVLGTAVLGLAWDLAHVAPSLGGVVGCQVLQGVEDGFCGALTTVSTWVGELAGLRRRRQAYVYGGASVVVAYAVMVAIMGGLRWSRGFGDLACLH